MLVLIVGVSGAGKDTLKNSLLNKDSKFTTLPAYTTREMRINEVQGGTYHFVSKEKFEQMIENDEFYEYSNHHNNYYGTSKILMKEKIKSGKIILKDMDVNGVENLKNVLKDDVKVISIFLKVPKQTLKDRLLSREDKLNEDEINLRLSRYDYENSKAINQDYVITNNNFEKTLEIVTNIIEQEYKYNNK